MANPEHVETLKQGVTVWNRWREENWSIVPDLEMAHLSEADLRHVNLSKAILRGAELSRVNLRSASLTTTDLTRADLTKADLSKADLKWADLRGAVLKETILSKANLFRANLSWAELNGTNFGESRTINTIFTDVDLSKVVGLKDVEHIGPSSIGIDTIYKSQGKIPEVFLRGCGVPENFIAYMKSFTMNPIEYYSCFISHSTRDAEFAERLYTDLQHKKVRCWYAPEDMKGGKKLYPQIDEAIRLHDKLVLILSENSINSPWVATEIKRTRKYEQKEERQRLFPISLIPYGELRDWELFDADTGTDLAEEVRSYFIPDFSNWKDHDSYKKAFDRLLKDLKAE